MKKIIFSLAILSTTVHAEQYQGSQFSNIWNTVTSDAYSYRPTEKVSTSKFIGRGVDMLLKNAKRTISSKEDLLPDFNKLLHPNGICLKGTWNITSSTPYTGYYGTDSKGLIIARASVALSDTEQRKYRGFGMAGKIFPTDDEGHEDNLKTANFFVIDDLAGTKEKYYTRAAMTNKPKIGLRFNIFGLLGVLRKANSAFGKADEEAGVRQLHEVSELELESDSPSVTPKWMMIIGESDSVSEKDFRDELDIKNYQGALRFGIYVSDANLKPEKRNSEQWKRVGYIEYTESVNSYSCDHRLHFHHPKFRK
jgi:hypothetical protein